MVGEPEYPKRKRTTRATNGQIEALLANLEQRPFLNTRRFSGFHGRENFEKGWKEVAEELNNISNGSVKTPEQWITLWRDLKSRTSVKACKLRRERVRTGNRAITTSQLTEIEKRVISIIGGDYTFGTDCPDSMPELDIQALRPDVQIFTQEEDSAPPAQFSGERRPDFNSPTPQSPTHSGPRQSVNPDIGAANKSPILPITHTTRKRRRNLNPRHTVAQQFNQARREFLAVAQSNAESLKMLAAAMANLSEAAKVQAQALEKIGDALILLANK